MWEHFSSKCSIVNWHQICLIKKSGSLIAFLWLLETQNDEMIAQTKISAAQLFDAILFEMKKVLWNIFIQVSSWYDCNKSACFFVQM